MLSRANFKTPLEKYISLEPESVLQDLVPGDKIPDLMEDAPTPVSSGVPDETTPVPGFSCDEDCFSLIQRVRDKADGKGNICTGEADFIDSGSSADGNSDWFRVTSQNNCFVVVAKSGEDRGYSGQYCFVANDLAAFVEDVSCKDDVDRSFVQIQDQPMAAQDSRSGLGMACLTNGPNFQRCGEGIL